MLRDDFAPPVDGFFAAGLRAALLRAAPAPDDFAREGDAFFAVLRFAVDALVVDALAAERLAPARALDFLAPPLRDEPEPELVLALPSTVHLPDITRCAASATASAISEPSLVALAIMLVAACDALSAASRPASRIARRALGLALIAAAAAASPAASISLLIAPFASLSTVLLPELEDDPDDLEDVFRAGLAIASISLR